MRRDGEASEEDTRMLWAAMTAQKESLEIRIADLEAEHHALVWRMIEVAQEARAGGITLSRLATYRKRE